MERKEVIEVLHELCHNTMGNPPYRINEATQAIKKLLVEKVDKMKKAYPSSHQDIYLDLAEVKKLIEEA